VREDDPLGDRQALEALAARCGRFSPVVGLEESADPAALLLDITGVAHLFGGEAALARKIVDDFARQGLTARVAVADTVGAAVAWRFCGSVPLFREKQCRWSTSALLLRSSGTRDRGDSPISPEVTVRERGEGDSPIFPAGKLGQSPVILPPGETVGALRPLPIEALRLPAEVSELLHQLGIWRIGQLEPLPREELSSRFGPELLRRWDQAAGRLAEPVPAAAAPPEFRADWSPEHPTARQETVEAALERLIGRVAGQLARAGRGAVQLECRLDCVSSEPVRVPVGLFRPTASARHLFGLVQMQFQRLRLSAPVSGVNVSVAATAPLEYRQEKLFADGDERVCDGPRQLAALVDRLGNRLGRRAVVRPRLLRDAQPELAYCYDPLIGIRRRRRHRRKSKPADLPPRPLRLLSRPLALTAVSIVPDGPPMQFHLRGSQHRVEHAWGPERIETGWWRGRAVGRDYYRIQTTSGHRYWLFRRLRDGRWFVHGIFE